MITVLVDHNIEGQAVLLWGTLVAEGWSELLPLRLTTFAELGLPIASTDRAVWRFAQAHEMLLLTDNRNMADADSLEQTIRDENLPASLPILTIGDVRQVVDKTYRERCVTRLIEICLDLSNYRGAGRLFIP